MNPSMNERTLVAIAMTTVFLLGSLFTVTANAATGQEPVVQSYTMTQKAYPSPEEAAMDLYTVVKNHDVKSIYKVLGKGSEKLIYTGDEVADQQMRERFLAAYDTALKIEMDGDAKAILLLGEKLSPFPFPLVKIAQRWQFDAKAGAEEIVNRRIGANELNAIKYCLAYGDAQREYAERDRDGDGMIEYAQNFRSNEGKQDGLYWPSADGEPLSPLGLLAARAKYQGYSAKGDGSIPFHGYYYRILTSQGKDAAGGKYDYIVNGNMIGGYALLAIPARWGASGVMSFICNHDGVVYEKNLGESTADVAMKIMSYNPDASWSKVK